MAEINPTQETGGSSPSVKQTSKLVSHSVHTSDSDTQAYNSNSRNDRSGIEHDSEGDGTRPVSAVDVFTTPADRKIGRSQHEAGTSNAELAALGFPDTAIDFSSDSKIASAGSRSLSDLGFSTTDFLNFPSIDNLTATSAIPAIGSGETKSGAPKAAADSKYTLDSMLNYFQQNFDQLDKNHDDKVDSSELAQEMKNPNTKEEDGIYLATMYTELKNFDRQFTKVDPDSRSILPPVLTKDNLKSAKENFANNTDQQKLKEDMHFLKKDFSKIDSNSDSCLTVEEIDEALNKNELSDAQKERLLKLKNNFDTVSKSSDDNYASSPDVIPQPLTPREGQPKPRAPYPYTEYQDDRPVDGGEETPKPFVSIKDVETLSSDDTRVKMEIQTELNDTIEHMQQKYGVEQFDNSTCFALSPYSAVNEKDPEGTKNWVTDNKDGTVTVKFPGDPNHPVTIQKPTKAEVAEFSGDETTATIEKAFSQYLIDSKNPEKFTSIIPDKSSLNFPQEYARKSKGGFPEAALKLFTNSEVKTQELAYATDSDVITALTDATNQNRAIIADSKEDQSYKSPITFNHSYKVGFDPITNEVILTNPNKPSDRCTGSEPSDRNGKALDGRDDGVFRISVEQFRESFLRFHSADVKKAQDS